MLARTVLGSLVLAVGTASANAAMKCPLIRPSGLSGDQVNAVVLAKFAEHLRRPPDALDRSKTIKELDGTENAILTYSFAALSVGEELGFDSIATFWNATQAKGRKQPFDTITIAEAQGLARREYFAGKDSQPPAAVEGSELELQRITVRAPSPASGWSLVRCTSDQIVFQRKDVQNKDVATAAARLVNLPSYRDEASFLSSVRGAVEALVPSGFAASLILVEPVRGTEVPCAQFEARAASLSGEVHGRFCYSAKNSTLGYAAFFSHNGDADARQVKRQAEVFIVNATPRGRQ